MRMRRKSKQQDEPEVPVSSFSDIAFLLIIFFILVTTLTKRAGFMTDMPAGQEGGQQTSKTATVQLHDQKIVFNEKPQEMDELRKALSELKLQEKEGDAKIVMLETTGNVPYQRYFEVMSAISNAGGVIAIVSEEQDEDGG
ncbi:MAG: biopolymer transporter ExbD [Planctomycetes bacterium]|nr:biopolymer transporter ExbD [Planctomycetota bacterium]